MPWLLWCFERQQWLPRELVIVDSSPEPLQVAARQGMRVVAAPPGTGVARKRNLALQEARGDIVTWFDDDWQHPHKLEWLVEALRDGAPYAGSPYGWFVELMTLYCTPYHGSQRHTVFNSAGFEEKPSCHCAFRKTSGAAAAQHLPKCVRESGELASPGLVSCAPLKLRFRTFNTQAGENHL